MDYIEKDGVRIYSKAVKPPEELPGYSKDISDPYKFHFDFVDCQHRTTIQRQKPCGKFKTVYVCKLLNRDVNPDFCEYCEHQLS